MDSDSKPPKRRHLERLRLAFGFEALRRRLGFHVDITHAERNGQHNGLVSILGVIAILIGATLSGLVAWGMRSVWQSLW